tara:strand:+ start:35180 stop:36385 length:1206 start_codon:yes stop_codon:yes gene_type:complete
MFYKGKESCTDLCVCIIDDTDQYKPWMRELVKNTADYTITNVTGFGYDVYIGRDEHLLLKQAASLYKKAVVISAGTEFINGRQFFDNLNDDFFILGHILDMGDGYYGLHYQCYVINLDLYTKLGSPNPGNTEMLSAHIQTVPVRSAENIHDDYTPLWIKPGTIQTMYKNKFHGWRLISSGLEAGYKISAFDQTQRDGKHFLYRDVDTSDWIYKRYNYCLANHIFDTSTGSIEFPRPYTFPISHLVHPAAGMNWLEKLKHHGYNDNTKVTFFDYNENALEAMYQKTKNINLKFDFIHIDIIAEPESLIEKIDSTHEPAGVVIHMSNIFAYEGTASLMPLRYRVQQENLLIKSVQRLMPICILDFDQRAAEGIVPWRAETGVAKDLMLTDLSTSNLPLWHTYD